MKIRSTSLKYAKLVCENKAFLRAPLSSDFWSLSCLQEWRKRVLWRKGKESNGTISINVFFQSNVQWGLEEARYCQALWGSCCWKDEYAARVSLAEQTEKRQVWNKRKADTKRCLRCEELEKQLNRIVLVTILRNRKLQWKRLNAALPEVKCHLSLRTWHAHIPVWITGIYSGTEKWLC